MKQIVNAALGGRSFIFDEDAYHALISYLDAFKSDPEMGGDSKEVMDEVEVGIADIFQELLASARVDVVNKSMVEEVIRRMGMPNGCSFDSGVDQKKLFRDPDDNKIGGVCSGLAAYFNIDVTLVRVIFLIALLCGSVGFWVYLVFLIAMPMADTAAQKCMMRGEKITAENMKKYSSSNR